MIYIEVAEAEKSNASDASISKVFCVNTQKFFEACVLYLRSNLALGRYKKVYKNFTALLVFIVFTVYTEDERKRRCSLWQREL
ncbi:MAG: hypothetical protein IJ773_14340 [Lachnospiraceae bacterium]|nr:hypothetical protein [Lachnospiraceae bacterium]